MMTKLTRSVPLLVSLAVCACATTAGQSWPENRGASAARFERHVETLASDEYEGREAGTSGYDKAVGYVVDEFEALGLKPAGTEGFLQQVPLRRAYNTNGVLTYEGAEGPVVLEDRESFLLDPPVSSDPDATFVTNEVSGQVVFAGYGIAAPSLGIDSYEDIDVEGRIVLLMQGVPDGLPSEESAHFSSNSAKIAEAVRRGARGVLLIGTQDESTEEFADLMARYGDYPDNTFAGRHAERQEVVTGMIFRNAANDLFAAMGADMDVAATPNAEGVIEPEALEGSMTLLAEGRYENYTAPNVVAMIEGSDPRLKNEYVVLSAHLDHVGIDEEQEEGGDTIHNGAMDNATGIATLLEEARRFSQNGERPRRSIIFAAVTAEEKGLLGSDYYAQNPTVPKDALVANVNLDMPVLLYEFEDVLAFGAEHSSLEEVVSEAAESMGVTLTEDPYPEMVLFVRSDHYSFVKQGVPSVFLFPGVENGGTEAFQGFMTTHYHQPSDEPNNPDLPIDYETGAKFAELNYRIAKAIANADERPEWNQGDFFGDLYARRSGS